MKKLSQLFGIKSQLCIAFVVILAIGFSACNDNLEDVSLTSDELVPMQLSVSMAGNKASTYASKYEFNMGEQIGIFISENEFPAYNRRARFSSSQWDLDTPIFLSNNPTHLRAYYPYKPNLDNEDQIRIEHVSQTDYMYGRSLHPISDQNPHAFVQMNHALALVQFCFKRGQLSFEGRIKKIEVANTGDEIGLYSSGFMSLTGQFSVCQIYESEPATILDYQMMEAQMLPFVPAEYQSEMQYPRIMVMPMDSLSHTGQVSIRFHIDNNVYTYPLPKKTAWRSGYKYTYNVTVYSSNILIEKGFIQDWIEGD